MEIETYLNDCIEKYFKSFLSANKFHFVASDCSSVACLKDFENEELRIRFLNDRGIVEIDFSSIGSHDFVSLNSIMQIEKNREKATTFGQGNRIFDFREQSDFLNSEYKIVSSFFK